MELDGTTMTDKKGPVARVKFYPSLSFNKTPGTIVRKIPLKKIDEKLNPIYRS